MPKKKLRKTLQRDKYSRKMTGHLYDVAKKRTQEAYKMGKAYMEPTPIKKLIKRPKRRQNRRNVALTKMRNTAWETGKPIFQSVYDMGKPYIRKTLKSISDKTMKGLENITYPSPPNKPSWVDLRHALSDKLQDVDILDDGDKIDINIFFRGVDAFLKKYKDTEISKKDINQAMWAIKGRDPGSALEASLKRVLKRISIKTIVTFFEYLFHEQISDLDTEMELDHDQDHRGFQDVVEKKRVERLAKAVIKLESNADRASSSLFSATLPRDKSRFTIELNHALKQIYDYIKDIAEDATIINRIRNKYNDLIIKHQDKEHDINNIFTELMDLDYGSKKKKKTKKKKRKHK